MILKIFDSTFSYDDDFESFCRINCIKNVLSYYGYEKSFIFMDTSLNMTLFRKQDSKIGYDATIKANKVFDRYKDKVIIREPNGKSAGEVWKENEAKLNEGIPLVVAIDLYELEYSEYYHKFHSNHNAILCGYTDDHKNAMILDSYQWQYKGIADMDQFLKARMSECSVDDSPYSGSPISNLWIEIKPDGWNGSCAEALKETLRLTLNNYYEADGDIHGSTFHGIDALKKISEIVVGIKDASDVKYQLAVVEKVRTALDALYRKLKLLRYFIKKSEAELNINELKKLEELLNNDIEAWRCTLLLFLKCTYRMNEKSLSRLTAGMNKLIEIEENRYAPLTELYGIL